MIIKKFLHFLNTHSGSNLSTNRTWQSDLS